MPGKHCCEIRNSLFASSSSGCGKAVKAYPPSKLEDGPTVTEASSPWVSSDHKVTRAVSRRTPISVCRPSAPTTTSVLVLNLKPTSPSQSLRIACSPMKGARAAVSSAVHLVVKKGIDVGSHTAAVTWTRKESVVEVAAATWGRSASQAMQVRAEAAFSRVHLGHSHGPCGALLPSLALVRGRDSSKRALSRNRSHGKVASPSSSSGLPQSWS
mmetsp:Transcript_114814/g.335785  ORF Transcript_114814/g.335785 Transcript_114814/m.335785 type:complete len:213 (-) Transcript_114814:579-1217(-)